jgi:hypothetical protein
VGGSTYDHLPLLPSVDNGLRDLAGLLVDPTTGGVFRPELTTVLTNPGSSVALFEALDHASKKAKDTLLLYFAGHALVTRRGELTLAIAGTRPEADYTAASYDSIRSLIADSPARRSLVILDCCYSGRSVNVMGTLSGLADAPSTYILTSTGSAQVSLAPAGSMYTSFSGALIDILRNGISGGPKVLEIDSIYQAIYERSMREGIPRPQLRKTGDQRIALGWNRASPQSPFGAVARAK